jgi:hypothetical protein
MSAHSYIVTGALGLPSTVACCGMPLSSLVVPAAVIGRFPAGALLPPPELRTLASTRTSASMIAPLAAIA